MSKTRGINDFDRSKFNSPSSDDCQCPDTPTSSKRLERPPHRINTRECRSKRNVDPKKVNRSPSSGYEKPGIERRYTRRETAASPVVKVTSVEVIKSWSRDCRLWGKDKEKLVRDSSSNRSSSSGSPSPRNPLQRTKIQNPPPRSKSQNEKLKKSDADSCSCCDCIDYLRAERLKLLRDSKRHSKSRGTFTPHPGTCRPQGSPTQKLCSMLKTREAKRISGCTCINDDWNPSCSIDCRCPESPIDISGRTYSKASKKSTLTNDNAKGPDEDHQAESSCSCSSPDQSPSPKLNLRDLRPTVAAPGDWRKYGEHLKKFSDEYRLLSSHLKSIRRELEAAKKPGETFRKRITRRYPNKEFSFEVRSTGDNSHRKNTSTCLEPERIDRSCQCPNPQDLPKAITAMQPKFRRPDLSDPLCSCQKAAMRPKFLDSPEGSNHKNHRRQEGGKSKVFACKTSRCDCKPEAKAKAKSVAEDLDKIGDDNDKFDQKKLRRSRQKRRIRRHDFSLPRIVPVNRDGRSRDENRMMIYPPKDQVGCPLTLYKSGSFVNCSVEQVDDVGFKYDVSYIQRYVSRPWQPGEYSEPDVKSDYLSTDDYG
ncbi:uncharacterized protein LOC107048842 [Diachasma alloeum]|uniref:uncharacterized protein LOC107048842 n=1 Tax=Diachasma alloeum TaxID=454923 RepID=UPI0007384386|nr:uncharacterized protein LOC107048842 [Diachasma alloeum]